MNRRTGITAGIVIAVLVVAGIIVGSVLSRGSHPVAMTQPADLAGITMVDAKVGWALTKDDQIFRTADGGATWTDVSIFQAPHAGQDIPPIAASFVNASTAFVTTNAGTYEHPQVVVYRTTDQGATWERTDITAALDWERDDVGGFASSFPDTLNGYVLVTSTPAVGQMGKALYRTTDGAKTFSFVGDLTGTQNASGTETVGVGGYPTGMVFSTPDTGFVTCYSGAWTHMLLFQTSNSGMSWQLVSLPVPSDLAQLSYSEEYYADIYPPVFFGADRKGGVMLADFVQGGVHTGQFYRTTDGGRTWTMGPVSGNASVTIYSMISENSGWGVDQNGKLYGTTNGGTTWTAVPAAGQ